MDPDGAVGYWICWDAPGELVPEHPETCHLADVLHPNDLSTEELYTEMIVDLQVGRNVYSVDSASVVSHTRSISRKYLR